MPGSHLFISSLPGWALRMHVETQGALPIQQAFSKPCVVNLISKVNHLVFSIYQDLCYHEFRDTLILIYHIWLMSVIY